MKKLSPRESIEEIVDFFETEYPTGSEYQEAMTEVVNSISDEPFSENQIDELLSKAPGFFVGLSMIVILARAGHLEILPRAKSYFLATTDISEKLSLAAAIAFLGDETGYQYIEDTVRRFMNKEDELKGFDIEWFVHIMDTILTNDRGKEMLARFRKEANYYVEWETYVRSED